ncbi:MAG TPA: hypothetical protein DHU96_12600 [Actinobacteria bacterium]|nr:hypothetical protein [Actinomycetota bacterium]
MAPLKPKQKVPPARSAQRPGLAEIQKPAPSLVRRGGPDNRAGLVRGNVVRPPMTPGSTRADSASGQRRGTWHLPGTGLFE